MERRGRLPRRRRRSPPPPNTARRRANGTWLLEQALNLKTPVIYDTIQTATGEERVVNQDETLAAREKQKLIKEKFKAWVFAEPDRTERLVRIYNDTYNNLRPRLFDGSHLDFPGMSQGDRAAPAPGGRRLARHERRQHAAGPRRRGGQDLHDGRHRHEDEAGRAGPESRCIVVPNHMLEQFGREFMQLYPNAKLLVATRTISPSDRRKLLTAKIASGEWDGIIVTHSQLRADRHVEATTRSGSCASRSPNTTSCSATRAGGSTPRNIIKTIEKQKARREERLKDLLAEDKKDDGLVFDELGVDHVFIDEAHYFKNLETPTKMDRVAGIQTGGSERAFDLYMKARYLGEKHPGHGVTFATGTPITNTMVELYTMQRFLDPEGLKSRGIEHFDAWAATFGEVVDTMEISPDGATPAAAQPLRQLRQPARAAADVPGLRRRADGGDARPAPPRAGRRQAADRSPARCRRSRRALQQALVARYERLRIAEGRSPRGQRPGDHHRRPQAGPRRPAAVGRRRRITPTRRSTPWPATSPRIWRKTAADARHADDLLRHGRQPDAWGYSRL